MNTTFTPATNYADIAVAMDRSLREFNEAVRPVLEREDVKTSDQNVLLLLAMGEGTHRINDLARNHAYQRAQVDFAIKGLESAGLVKKERDRADNRAFNISYTPRGRKLVKAIRTQTGSPLSF